MQPPSQAWTQKGKNREKKDSKGRIQGYKATRLGECEAFTVESFLEWYLALRHYVTDYYSRFGLLGPPRAMLLGTSYPLHSVLTDNGSQFMQRLR